ncbi:unnamed protein product [Gongylonema pulchrum]|uniref:Uncharacterized protein n=1 Tax=Gongylonema pulchrum TaxID=637853 RepID=A0A183EBI4_9BILA|nr:unnamed protein product [Gongylonema pulchrum]
MPMLQEKPTMADVIEDVLLPKDSSGVVTRTITLQRTAGRDTGREFGHRALWKNIRKKVPTGIGYTAMSGLICGNLSIQRVWFKIEPAAV